METFWKLTHKSGKARVFSFTWMEPWWTATFRATSSSRDVSSIHLETKSPAPSKIRKHLLMVNSSLALSRIKEILKMARFAARAPLLGAKTIFSLSLQVQVRTEHSFRADSRWDKIQLLSRLSREFSTCHFLPQILNPPVSFSKKAKKTLSQYLRFRSRFKKKLKRSLYCRKN